MAQAIHMMRMVNGKESFHTVCKTNMGIRGQQILTKESDKVTCKKCISRMK